jgi:hypothetical protein
MRTVIAVHRSSLHRAVWVILLGALLLVALALALAEPVWADTGPAQLTGRVVDVLGKPVAGANVHVVSRAGGEQVVKTDKDGRYRAPVPAGAYSIVFAFRGTSAQKSATVDAGAEVVVDGELELADGEVIQIRDMHPPPVLPRPVKDPRITPKYSDEAILKDVWAKAWILLDVSATGEVIRLKMLKRPGYDLDEIAVRGAFDLEFEPARDHSGRPVATLVIWGMEWPSYGWLQAFETTTRIPPYERDPLQPGRPSLASVPCYGSGPLNLSSIHPTYRDCSRPDVSRVNELPWIEKP